MIQARDDGSVGQAVVRANLPYWPGWKATDWCSAQTH